MCAHLASEDLLSCAERPRPLEHDADGGTSFMRRRSSKTGDVAGGEETRSFDLLRHLDLDLDLQSTSTSGLQLQAPVLPRLCVPSSQLRRHRVV
jgi:hypothetical protein